MLAVNPLCAKEKWPGNGPQTLSHDDDFGTAMQHVKQAERAGCGPTRGAVGDLWTKSRGGGLRATPTMVAFPSSPR